MEEPELIVSRIKDYFARSGSMSGLKVAITAGPTYERLDPVRFIGNYSSGKMGFALAEECAARGAEVTLISGPVSLTTQSPRITRIDVESAQEMCDAALCEFPEANIGIFSAAVADYRPAVEQSGKIKRENKSDLTLELVRNPDIALECGRNKRADQVFVGFALETDNELANASSKLSRKNLDMIVLNSLRDKGAGFRTDTNKVTIVTALGETAYPLKSKREVAVDIIDAAMAAYVGKRKN